MKTLDMRFTWLSAAPILVAAIQDGTADGKQAAKEELVKMALAADLSKDLATALKELVRLKAIKRRIDSKTATPAERADYKRNKETAWSRASTAAERAIL